ncbi:DMT family transporter [Shimia biformata]|uniref:DMT family transporter n=1 Tax=Shimia biformata TaxID=1294299 RepID=UPI00194ECE1F|nr:DMT family transporter [Shimia biformata]
MRLFLLTALTMAAFAANSVLNRAALAGAGFDAVGFATLRLISGSAALAVIVAIQQKRIAIGGGRRAVGVTMLLLYLFGFSLAYRDLDAGLGALILFGTVQVTMLGVAARTEGLRAMQWIGAALAFCGLVWLLWPSEKVAISIPHALFMVAAGIGWGVYSLTGRQETDATQGTAMNFVLAIPVALTLWWGLGGGLPTTAQAALLAILSGVVTSGMGYALWYAIIPALGPGRAAVAQLTVPVIATIGGVLFLAEAVTPQLLAAGVVVLGGVALSLSRR